MINNQIIQGLVEKKLLKVKSYDNGLRVLKYSRNAFFNSAWREYPILKEMRGLVIDGNCKIIAYPFTKVMNYLQENTTVERDREVSAIHKINGFMACLSTYNGELLVSTTGTLDSQYAKLAKEVITTGLNDATKADLIDMLRMHNTSLMFEIAHESDPHIIKEKTGAYLTGARDNYLGSSLMGENLLNQLHCANYAKNWLRPTFRTVRFSDILLESKTNETEGYMIRDVITGEVLCKLKTPYYSSKKHLMRANQSAVQQMFKAPSTYATNKGLDARFRPVVDAIVTHYSASAWVALDEQLRSAFIEQALSGEVLLPVPTQATLTQPTEQVQPTTYRGKLFLLRGLPNSGKSTTAQAMLAIAGGDAVHVEADMYFTAQDGTYDFEPAKLGDAHDWCRRVAEDAMQNGHTVIVSNTFTTNAELAPYYELANAQQYQVFSLIVEARHAGADNGHTVPENTVDKMRRRFSIQLNAEGAVQCS